VEAGISQFFRTSAGCCAVFGFHVRFDGIGLGIEIDSNLKQHLRKSDIVSGLSHLSRARGPLSEMVRVQRFLLNS
jgi:hypothetical protein